MFVRSTFGRCMHDSQAIVDRLLASKNYHRLVESQYWDCSTPTKALSVLGVLIRSGTVIDKLDKAASSALSAMTPSMTRNEQAVLGKWSSFLQLKGAMYSTLTTSDAVKPVSSKTDVNSAILILYSHFMKNNQMTTLTEVKTLGISSTSVLQLDAMTSLMLLEMSLSTSFQANGSWRDEGIAGALLTRLRHHVMWSDVIGFKAVWWILDILNDTKSFLRGRPLESGRLFRACIQRLHVMLPKLSAGNCLLIFPLLNNVLYERPFIICADVMKRLAACELEELNVVPTSVVIRVLASEGLLPCLRRKLYRVLCRDYRMSDMGRDECLFLLSTIATTLPVDKVEKKGNNDIDYYYFCELLFAQIYVTSKGMNVVECVKALEYMELMHLSNLAVLPSCDLLERLKENAFSEARRALKRPNVMLKDLELNLEAVHRLEGLLKRCVLLPFLFADASAVSDLVKKLTQRLKKTIY